ncbi:hypothetical protein BDW60DRAFT_225034 [Aspergillus nidulans var. acristatus]
MTTVAPTVSVHAITSRNAMRPGPVPPGAATNMVIVDWGLIVDCADDVCVAGCDRRAECDPGGYGEFADSSKCPLNVCCSKFGFCGTTKDFCGNKKVKRPSCSKDNGMTRVVGYYEGWSMRRYCNSFYPEQIPIGVYTHLNYAFASIDPETFEVLAPSSREAKMMRRLTSLKESDPDLKVFVAVGGWTFNDPGPTVTVFSDIARSEANQKTFFRSLISFMSTYNFDGIDLDWEYPVADDRSGRPEDFENFPKFIANLKKALKASGGRDGLSITLPASYWYLQHFDIVKLQNHVDFFNIMSYDLHGAWDQHSEWLEPQLNSHTNLTEITNALDLLWRNNIHSDKVVLGLAFYARVFAAADPNCMNPGCIFQSGGNAGPCSNEVGVMLNSEIVEIMDKRGVKPTFDEATAVKILKFDNNQWLTYDDADTFKLKVQFASSQCLGGVMVWAVSHDLPQGNFSLALADAANRKIKAIAMSAHSEQVDTQTQNCPAGWTIVPRSDDGSNGEAMIDHNACPDGTNHFFCCPPDSELPTCGWYGHRNGDCNGKDNCPAGMIEIGSNGDHCENNNYEAACCTHENIPSMKLYTQCTWGKSPKCDDGTCSGGTTLVANSSTGSGGDFCHYRDYWEDWKGNYATYQERVYCCEQEEDAQWDDCEWNDAYGLLWAEEGQDLDNYCWSNCPEDTVRVALETRNGCDDGGRVQCCKPKYLTVDKNSNKYTEEEKQLEQSLKEFLKDPRSWMSEKHTSGNASFDITENPPPSLVRRASTKARDDVHEILYQLVFVASSGPTPSQLMNMWSLNVYPLYEYLTPSNVRGLANEWWNWANDARQEYIAYIICNMDYYNKEFGDMSDGLLDCECELPNCCVGDVCDYEEDGYVEDDSEENGLVTRGNSRPIVVNLSDGSTGKIFGPAYTRKKTVENDPDHPMRKKAFGFAQSGLCASGDVDTQPILVNSDVTDYQIEHKIEMKQVGIWIDSGNNRKLPSGKPVPADLPALPLDYVKNHLREPVLVNPPPMKGGQQSNVPLVRIMNALGSTKNNEGFVLLLESINGAKGKIWRKEYPMHDDETKKLAQKVDQASAKDILSRIRTVAGVISYLNHPAIQGGMVVEAHEVEAEIRRADNVWVAKGNPEKEIGVRWWRLVYKDVLESRSAFAKKIIEEWCAEVVKYWGVRSGDLAKQVMQAVGTLRESHVKHKKIPWGFTIYRTTYTPLSETHFAEIIELINVLTKENIRTWEGGDGTSEEKSAAKTTLLEHYQPIIMNDKTRFDGMTLDNVRSHYQAYIEASQDELVCTNENFFVVIDEEVVQTLAGADPAKLLATDDYLRDVRKYWVKAVETDLEDEDDDGWIKCTVYRIWNMWADMDGSRPIRVYAALYPNGPYAG